MTLVFVPVVKSSVTFKASGIHCHHEIDFRGLEMVMENSRKVPANNLKVF